MRCSWRKGIEGKSYLPMNRHLQSSDRLTARLLSRPDLIQSVLPSPIFLTHTTTHQPSQSPISFVDRQLPFMWLNVRRGWIGLPKLKNDYRMICLEVFILYAADRGQIIISYYMIFVYLLAWKIHFHLTIICSLSISHSCHTSVCVIFHLKPGSIFF